MDTPILNYQTTLHLRDKDNGNALLYSGNLTDNFYHLPKVKSQFTFNSKGFWVTEVETDYTIASSSNHMVLIATIILSEKRPA